MSCTVFLNPNCVTVPIMDSPCILELKWDNYLPDVIRDAIQLQRQRKNKETTAKNPDFSPGARETVNPPYDKAS